MITLKEALSLTRNALDTGVYIRPFGKAENGMTYRGEWFSLKTIREKLDWSHVFVREIGFHFAYSFDPSELELVVSGKGIEKLNPLWSKRRNPQDG